MKRKRNLIAGLSAMLVAAALVAVSAVSLPTPTQAASDDAAPTIRVRDTGDTFIVRWTPPEGVNPQDQVVRYWTDDGYTSLTRASHSVSDDAREYEITSKRSGVAGTAYGFRVEMSVDGETVSSPHQVPVPPRACVQAEAGGFGSLLAWRGTPLGVDSRPEPQLRWPGRQVPGSGREFRVGDH